MKFRILTLLPVFLLLIQIADCFSQGSANLLSIDKKFSAGRRTLSIVKENNTLSAVPEVNFSENENLLMKRIEELKLTESGTGEQIVSLQRQLEESSGYAKTLYGEESICRMELPKNSGIIPHSTQILVASFIPATDVQVEQRGITAGRIWVAIGVAGLDTGANATPDTLIMFYSDNGGESYTEYVRAVFSESNKINFDDLDMEIVEPVSGEKYIYLLFGYTTGGYLGYNRVGYVVIRTPTPAVYGSTFFFPGQVNTTRYFNPRVVSDNARYASVPYVFVSLMQDSVSGSDHYLNTKVCYFLSPYNMNPPVTYLPQGIYTADQGFTDFDVATDIAHYHNGGDSIYLLLSNYPGYTASMYFYRGYSNTASYPVAAGSVMPSGWDISDARIASNGGTNQGKMMATYTENYNNTGDFDQYLMFTENRSQWNVDILEFNGIYNSGSGNIIARRNAEGSFAIAFKNRIGSLENVVYTTYTGNFGQSSYVHRANPDYANGVASPKPAFRNVSGDSCHLVWSYFYRTSSTSECSAVGLYLKYAVEGYFDEVLQTHSVIDAVTVYLADENYPHNFVDTAIMYLDHQLLINEAAFYDAPPGNYYIVLKHYNALETWSSVPVAVNNLNSYSSAGSYDFTTASSQAYGSNMMLKGTHWCLYSGDVDQDGTIDGTDLQIIDNDAYNFVFGLLLVSDLNGDQFVDGGDYLIADNNATNFISVIRP